MAYWIMRLAAGCGLGFEISMFFLYLMLTWQMYGVYIGMNANKAT